MGLPVACGTNPKMIHEFYSKLFTHVQALETMGKLNMINGYVRTVVDCLPGIRSYIVRNYNSWEEWEFPQFVTAPEKWTQRDSISNNEIKKRVGHHGKEKMLNTKQHQMNSTTTILRIIKMLRVLLKDKKKVMEKKLCFNCASKQHRAPDCRSKRTCSTCNGRHHSSVGSKLYPSVPTMSSTNQVVVTHSHLDGVKCRALMDTVAGSSCVSADLMNVLKKKPIRKEAKHIEITMNFRSFQSADGECPPRWFI